MDTELRDCLMSLDLLPRGAPRPLGGGDIAAVSWLDTDQGPVVIKHDDPERLAGEAEGLRVLRQASSRLVVPDVLGEGDGWLVMEALESTGRAGRDETALGEGLRELHGASRALHGWHRDNACGTTPQPNAPLEDGRVFQRERRLLPLTRACHDRGLVDDRLRARLEAVAADLETWLPSMPASLVHGDLWSGNVLFTRRGPAIIDPAIYRHYPEVDLAMLTLFGAPGAPFFAAYWDGHEPSDWPRREALFQLYPLLNHLLLFGSAYRSGVERALSRVEAG
ncbi:fructosamine kinase family protein [Halomonas elongata]|uniref:fructosamine kinase family protein n=1 Tax=Halomonas elongata TaxID=2746 RepID=UPI0023B1C0A4|nr:fructosamine kinase family protein [Halomonas elongata]